MHTKDRGVKFDEEKPESRLKILRLTNLNGQTALGVDYARLELCGKQIGSDYIQARRILWSQLIDIFDIVLMELPFGDIYF